MSETGSIQTVPETREFTRIFEQIYSNDDWDGGSGHGSAHSNNIEYIAFLCRFLERNEVTSVLDLGCGDWQFSRYINWEGVNYLGIDVVAPLLERNQKLYASANIKFEHFKETASLPPGDLFVCKDVMQHWPNAMVENVLSHIAGKYRHILITNDEEPNATLNSDIPVGGWRPIDFGKPPFNRRIVKLLSWYVPDRSNITRKSVVLLID